VQHQNLTLAIEIYFRRIAEPPYRDQDIWRGEIEYMVNVMSPLNKNHEANGVMLSVEHWDPRWAIAAVQHVSLRQCRESNIRQSMLSWKPGDVE
jgi:hypothetical protein